ncbi:endonuclease MutS2 [Sulfurimonas sp. HSL-1716]|uniref:endonuclease MutS2 n=1 Tax=Hydrocurvibacter sulfurireducens TaxID=3131937 RepID=UPI0031F90D14
MSINSNNHFDKLTAQLDLLTHIASLQSFFSREQSLYIEGDQERHFGFIKELEKLVFKAPAKIASFKPFIMHLKKQGVLRFEQIFEVVKLIRYIRYFKNLEPRGIIGEWIDKVVIPENFIEIEKYFDESGNFNEHLDETLYGLNQRVKAHKSEISSILKRLLHGSKLGSYLIDTQVHYLNDEECLLLRGGFNHVIKGSVVGRSTAGYFYVSPDAIIKEKQAIRYIDQEREALFYEYAKQFSSKLFESVLFLGFIDKEFDRFDHYQARIQFARSKDLVILHAQKNSDIVIADFKHPALEHAKSVSVDFTKNVLMITGVNAGGKTMFLKSILSSALMAKYLIPMSINENRSKIGTFKHIEAIIDDPQNVKNDISTFAGRMKEFAHLFTHRETLVGVDEIELGTDSDEAAALFNVILDELVKKGQKIVITTHHKRLASLMADREDVELLAALYDEERRLPTYEFLHGVIGKSYAFETASRYGIASNIVTKAREVYGLNHEKLSELIERGSTLERELKNKHRQVDEKLDELQKKELRLKELEESLYNELKSQKQKLKAQFDEAIDAAKKAANATDTAAIHRAMNKAAKALPKEEIKPPKKQSYNFSAGDVIKYRGKRGTVVSIKAKEAMIEVEGMRLRVKTYDLKPSGNETVKKVKSDLQLNVQRKSGLKCDLHGMRSDEALEVLDKFISDALIQGWDEVIVYHGIGTGKLSYAVKNYLKEHPKVKKFEDAPQHMGGYGAKLVYL